MIQAPQPFEPKMAPEGSIPDYQEPEDIRTFLYDPFGLFSSGYYGLKLTANENIKVEFFTKADSEGEAIESFVKEVKTVFKPLKIGRLNDGFTFFNDRNYSTRLIIKEKKVQGIELYTHKGDKDEVLELKIPVISEERFNRIGSMDSLTKAFKIPK